ncbi:MAG: flagellar motor protein MotB [Firmicutes bacterium]|nr:flagellar motor protein MotB [Bacillota bacterium]
MKRKKKSGGGGGANWMDTYGDMVTLLLCFFVLMYSMSTVTDEKWLKIVESFNPDGIPDPTANEAWNGATDDSDEFTGEVTQATINEKMDELFERLTQMVRDRNQEDNISVTRDGGRIFISFNQVVFFDGDSPVIKKAAEEILTDVSSILEDLQEYIDEVRVLGHTAQGEPNRPNNIRTDRTLASDRSTNVVIFIQEHCTLDPAKLISEGIGQWKPVATNSTAEGRAKNRRVEMIISGRDLEKELSNDVLQYQIID